SVSARSMYMPPSLVFVIDFSTGLIAWQGGLAGIDWHATKLAIKLTSRIVANCLYLIITLHLGPLV
ncbi:MAG: hypothetical protein V4493_09645, partial [Pseudomonadota bacterium]